MAFWRDIRINIRRAFGRGLAGYVRWVQRTSTVVMEPEDAREQAAQYHPFIFAMWHGQFVLMPTLQEGSSFKVSAIVARHEDAETIGALLGEFGMPIVRGAGAGTRKRDRGGATALRTALRVLRDDSTFAMTADVPPGPARRSGPGIVTLAKFSGRPIVPFAVATSRYIALPTWSRMTINLPYSRLAYVMGNPIFVPGDVDEAGIPKYQALIEEELDRTTARAYELAGADMRRATPPRTWDPSAPPAPIGFALRAYRFGTNLLSVAAPLILAYRLRQGKEDASRLSERYGIANVARPEGAVIWVHAASVGETNAILPLIDRLLELRPGLSVVLTTGTVTSAGLCAKRTSGRVIHQYVPLDSPRFVRAFLDHWKPQLAIFTESEIWPNLIIEGANRGIPLSLVNGRISNRSYVRWRRNKGTSEPLFSRFALVLAQNAALARSFSVLGARRVRALGNIKIDSPPPLVDAAALEELQGAIGQRPILLAASTHPGEEEMLASAHQVLRRTLPRVLTMIAPRHPERGPQLADMLAKAGFTVALRSKGALPDATIDIYIADTIGELGTLYALASVAFVGGSLVPHGGQNPIEAVRHGTVVVTGPHWTNFTDVYRAMLRYKGVREVKSPEELADVVRALFTTASELEETRAGAKAALLTLSGALEGSVVELVALLDAPVAVAGPVRET